MTDENDPEFQKLLAAYEASGGTSPDSADFQPTYSPGALPTVDSIKQGLLSKQLQMPGTYDPAPEQPSDQPPPPQVPGPGDALKALALQSIQGRLQAGMAPPDTEGLQRAQTLGNIGGLVQGLGSSISGMVGTPYGGAMNPAAYLGALATHRQQNFDQGTFNTQNAQNQPVQQYMQRQAQRQLGLAESQKASDEAIRYGNMLRAEANEQSLAAHRTAQDQAKAGTGTFSPEQKKTAQDFVAANYRLRVGEEPPQDLLDALSGDPKQTKTVLDTLNKKKANDDKLAEIKEREKDRRLSASERKDLQTQRLRLTAENLELRKAKFGVTLAQGTVPGVELSQPLAPAIAKGLQQRIPLTKEAQRAAQELADASAKAGLSGALGAGAAYGDLKAKFALLNPKISGAEYAAGGGATFTEGHRRNVEQMLEDPTHLRTALMNGSFQAEIKAIQKGLQDSLDTAIGTVGRKTSGPGSIKGVKPFSGVSPGLTGGGTAAPAGYAYSPDRTQRMPVDASGNPLGPIEANPGG